MVQINPEPTYNHRLVDRVVAYLHTGDSRLFPFTARFDEERRRAFMRDLREGLAEVVDSGSARKTSATGYVTRDQPLREVVREWEAARGGWPRGADPRARVTALGAVSDEDEGPGLVPEEEPVRGI